MKILNSVLLILALILIFSCVQKKHHNVTNQIVKAAPYLSKPLDTISAKIIRNINESCKFLYCSYFNKRFMVIDLKEKFYLFKIDNQSNIKFIKSFLKNRFEQLFVSNEKLIKLDTRSEKAYKLSLESDYYFKKSDSLKCYSLDTTKKIYEVNPSATRLMEFCNHFSMIVNYGIYERENINYLDKKSLVLSSPNKNIYIGKYQNNYIDRYLADTKTYFVNDTSGNIFFIGAYSNKVSKVSNGHDSSNYISLSNELEVSKFKEDDLTNLTYIRKYTAENEKNISIDLLNNDKLFIIRKLSQKKVIEQEKFEIIIINLKNKFEQYYLLAENIFPQYIIAGRKLIFITRDFKTLIEYDFI